MLSVFMTSSPSYVLMASIDSMTDILNEQGNKLFEAYTARLDRLYGEAKNFKHLCVLSRENLTAAGSVDHDRGKIAVKDMTGKLSGVDLSDMLHKQYGIRAEMATATYVLLMTSIADTDEGFDLLINALGEIDEKLSGDKLPETKQIPSKSLIREIKNNIKSALFSEDTEFIPIESAKGRIAADYVTIYPPDIPVVIPGEKITKDALDKILEAKKEGLQIIGLKDEEIEVLWEKYST